MADRQWMTPLGFVVDEEGEDEYMLPVGFVINEDQAAAVAGGQPTMKRWGGIPGMGQGTGLPGWH